MMGLLPLLMVAAASPPQVGHAEQFLRRLYAPYAHENGRVAPIETYASPALWSLIKRDQAGHPGEVGDYDDLDWVCRCQDWTRVQVQRIEARRNGIGVLARVTFRDIGQRPQSVRYRLMPAASGGWQIVDVALATTEGEIWATAALAREIAEQERSRAMSRGHGRRP